MSQSGLPIYGISHMQGERKMRGSSLFFLNLTFDIWSQLYEIAWDEFHSEFDSFQYYFLFM